MTRNILLKIALASVAAAMFGLPAALAGSLLAQAPAAGALAPRPEGDDMVMGLANAPVTVIEYASLTCSHCARFHENSLPQLKSNYVEKGLVKFVFRDFPLDGLALRGAMVARCAGPERYFAFLDAMFKQQRSWALADQGEAIGALKRLARFGGMAAETFDGCLNNKDVETAVLKSRIRGEQEFRVESTPTLIINGKRYPGALESDELDKILQPLIGKS